jgi:hypothetical protein
MFDQEWVRARQTLNNLDSLRSQCKKSVVPQHRQHSGSARQFIIDSAKRTRTELLWTVRFDWHAFNKQLGLLDNDAINKVEHVEHDMKFSIPAEHMLMLQDQTDGLWPHRIHPVFTFSDAFNSTHGLLDTKIAVFGTQQQLQQLEVEAAAIRKDQLAAAVEAFECSRSCGNRTCVLCPKQYTGTLHVADTADACVAITKDTCKQLLTLCNSRNWCACWDVLQYNDVFTQCESSGLAVADTVSRGCQIALDSTVMAIIMSAYPATATSSTADAASDQAMCVLLCVKVRAGCIKLSVPGVSANGCFKW